MLSYLLYYYLILISLLPMPVLHGMGNILSFLLYSIFGYRKRVVMKNLEGALPPGHDLKRIARRFYFFLGEMFMETIKCLTIGEAHLLRRMKCDNPEIMQQYAAQNRSVILMSAHYGNWEMLIYSMNLLFPHLAIGVGKPLSNKVLNRLINARRSKTGMKIINAGNIREEFEKDKDTLTASLFLSDQYPGGAGKGFPRKFMNRSTEFMYGAEKYARQYNYPVVYGDLTRIRRGYYNIHLVSIADQPAQTAYGEIMTKYTELLEASIRRQPEFWLWSHKRWKHLQGFYSKS